MTTAILKKISIQNFKGIAKYELTFNADKTTICGENGSGKSSIMYAWEWLLSQNVSNVLPMLNNKEVPNLVTSVVAEVEINNITYTFKRESKGKYVGDKKISNESTYSIDGVELTQKNYQEKVANILCDSLFDKLVLLTDKGYFNSDTTKWKWTDRRKFLLEMCGAEDKTKTILEAPQFENIKDYILKGYATSDIKSMLRKEKTGLKDQQNKNMILVENKQNEIAELSKINFEELETELQKLNSELDKIQKSSKKELQSEELSKLQNKLIEDNKELSKLVFADMKIKRELEQLMTDSYNKSMDKYNEGLKIDKELTAMIEQIEELGNSNVQGYCPTCNQKLPQEKINQVVEETNKKIEALQNEYTTRQKELEAINEEYLQLKAIYVQNKENFNNFKPNERRNELEIAIKQTEKALNEAKTTSLNNLSSENELAVKTQIKEINENLAKKQFIDKGKAQIELWLADSRDCADKLIQVELKETELDKYVECQTNIINDTVNQFFTNGISWSLYNETYKNGDGGISEDCVCLYNGKRYESLSDGEQNIADIEVIKILQNYFDVKLPLFIDRCEVITIPYTADCQVIELHAQKDTKLDGCIKITDLY